MKPSDTSRHDESRAVSQHQPGRAKLRRRPLRKRILGVGVDRPPFRGQGLTCRGGL
jgi:hypothetical protein